jgi:putative transposase
MIWDYADAALSRVAVAERQAEDLTDLTDKQRDEIADRRAILASWARIVAALRQLGGGQSGASTKDDATDIFLQMLAAGRIFSVDGRPVLASNGRPLQRDISRRTLYGWERKAGGGGGARSLIDARSTHTREAVAREDPYMAEFRHWYLVQQETRVSTCIRICNARARQEGWKIPSPDSVYRYKKSLPAGATTLARKGPEAFDNLCGNYAERDYTTLRVNEIWCGDHHPCDVFVHYQGRLVRPWISAWEDMRSRRVFYAFTPEPPDSDTILAALINGIRAAGLSAPDKVYIDNGKDYDCYGLQGVTKAQRIGRMKIRVQLDPAKMGGAFGSLGIEVMHARPYNPKAKPIERFFRSYSDDVDRFEPTYTGNKPDNKPEGLEEKVRKFNEAVRGQSPVDVARGIGHVVPSFEDYVSRAAAWIEGEYHLRGHHGHGMKIGDVVEGAVRANGDDGLLAPMDVYNALLCETTRNAVTEQQLQYLGRKTERPVKIGRAGGVRYDGRSYGRGTPELIDRQGELVTLRVDPANLKHVSVWTVDGTFICHAPENGRLPWGTTKEELRKVVGTINAQKRAAKVLGIKGTRVTTDVTEMILANRRAEVEARQSAGLVPPPTGPGGIKIIQPGFEPEAQKAAKALPSRRVAGGGEAFDVAAMVDGMDSPSGPRAAFSAKDVFGGDE